MFAANKVQAMQLDDVITFNKTILLKISNDNKDTIICCIYRSLNSNKNSDIKLYQTISHASDKYNTNLIILGDINYPHINWINPDNESINNKSLDSSNLFCNCISDNFLIQNVTKPTRICGSQKQNILDLIFTATNINIIDARNLQLHPF